ncbi:MAG: C39 family peptidase [Vulcanibacillus sp.]
MKKKRFILLLLITLIFVLQISVMAFEGNQTSNYYASIEEAKIVASKYITAYEFDTSIADIISIKEIYDSYENTIAYYLQLINSSDIEYYFVISTDKQYSPVLLAGKGELSILELENSNRLYYLGGLSVIQAKNIDNVITSINKNSERKYSKEDLKILNKNPNAKTLWDNALEKEKENVTISSYDEEQKQIQMEHFNQWDAGDYIENSACGPTSQATLAEYWRANMGKSFIAGLNIFTSEGSMIEHFWIDHNGNLYGMTVNGLKSGLVEHIGPSATVSDFNSFASYKSEINNNRPLAIKFDWEWFWEDQLFSYHWVTGLGYYYSIQFGQYLIVHDNCSDNNIVWVDYVSNVNATTMVSLNVQ